MIIEIDNKQYKLEQSEGHWYLSGCKELLGYSKHSETLNNLWIWASDLDTEMVEYGWTIRYVNYQLELLEDIEDFIIQEYGECSYIVD